MPYNTYAASVSTTPVEIFSVTTDGGRGPRGIRVSCTTANVILRLYGVIPDAENDEIVITAGDPPKEFIFSPADTSAITVNRITAYTASGTAGLTVETFAY